MLSLVPTVKWMSGPQRFYSGVSPMGLIWSMEWIGRPESEAPTTSVRLPVTVTFRAEARNGERAEASVIRALVGSGVTSKPLAKDGLLGVWFQPPGDGPHPAVIVLGGSEGGLPMRSAAPLLASHGYATLALAYFGLPGLPRGLVNIPLEYFGRAIAHVRASIAPRNDFVAGYGTSRGGELALLVASLMQIFVLWLRSCRAAWFSGASDRASQVTAAHAEHGRSRGSLYPTCGKTTAMTIRGSLIHSNLQSRARREFSMRCAISTPWSAPRFRSNGSSGRSSWSRVAMISFGRHSSSRKSRVLEGHNRPWPFEHISYPDAGHAIVPPYAPTTATTIVHPVTHQILALGGTPKGQIEANVAYWRRTLDFLAQAEARAR
jgi:BAAT / Acyl-CoA thioester hydrolase C terminal/Acyl-CoA thioester hydrolase/BAAT N-terminal region